MNSSLWAQRVLHIFCIAAGLAYFTASGRAATVSYTATDLPDIAPGDDLWRYDYTITGRTFAASEFFDVHFDPLLYSNLTAGPSPDPGWDVLILQQPNSANLPPFDTGIYDGFALTGDPSLAGTFQVSFVYLGPGLPGAQPYVIYGADASVQESGFTQLPAGNVPEPSTALSVLAGLGFCMAKLYGRRSRRQ